MLTLSEAAEQLGISRAALDNWIKRLEIEKKKDVSNSEIIKFLH